MADPKELPREVWVVFPAHTAGYYLGHVYASEHMARINWSGDPVKRYVLPDSQPKEVDFASELQHCIKTCEGAGYAVVRQPVQLVSCDQNPDSGVSGAELAAQCAECDGRGWNWSHGVKQEDGSLFYVGSKPWQVKCERCGGSGREQG